MNILLLLSKLKRSPKMAGIRNYTNLLYYDPGFVTIKISNFDTIEVDGCKWRVSDQLNMNQRIKGNPWFMGVRSTDIVVDIGANIGAMTIPYAKVAKKVYAVEPLFNEELQANVDLNELDNVEVIPFGIGKEGWKDIEFDSKCSEAPFITFGALKRQIGEPIDFLKMDGEGCEWDIDPSELKGIRELRIEFHIPRGKVKEYREKFTQYINWMKNNGYDVHIHHVGIGLNPYFAEYPEVRASLK